MKTATVHVDQQSIYHYQKHAHRFTWYTESLEEIAESHKIGGMYVYGPASLAVSKFSVMMRKKGFKTIPVECYDSAEHGKSRCNTTTAIAVGMMKSDADVIVLFTENEALNPALEELKRIGKFIILFTCTERPILVKHADTVLKPYTMERL
jgi:hypothetical protein